jgi:hypothetical protein
MAACDSRTNVPGHPLLALALALTVFTSATTAADQTLETSHAESADALLVKLEDFMRIKQPEAVSAALHSLGLELGEDFAILSDGEREEMLSGLAEHGISLGDRAKARYHFGTLMGDQSGAHKKCRQECEADASHSSGRTIGNGPRRAQDNGGGGVSSDSIALMATAALGIISFIVQARVSSNEQKQRADRDREHAERDKEQTRAGKLLERVQLQLAEFVDPANVSVIAALDSWIHICYAVGLEGYIAQYQIEPITHMITQPATPHVKTQYSADPKMWRAFAMAPMYAMHDADIEMLHGDAAKRQLYADLVEATYLPPLRTFDDIVATKSHLAPWFNPARLDKMLPGLGRSWATKSTLMIIFNELVLYARQFETVLDRMKAGDNSLLGPSIAGSMLPVAMALQMMKEAVSKKEMAQLGASQGKNTSAVTAVLAGGGEPKAMADT